MSGVKSQGRAAGTAATGAASALMHRLTKNAIAAAEMTFADAIVKSLDGLEVWVCRTPVNKVIVAKLICTSKVVGWFIYALLGGSTESARIPVLPRRRFRAL